MNKKVICISVVFLLLIGISASVWVWLNKQAVVAEPVIQESKDKEITIAAVGDIMLGRHVATKIARAGDYMDPVKEVVSDLNSADIRFGNLECVLSDRESTGIKGKPSGFTLKGPKKMIEILTNAGLNIVSIANNHAYDFGHADFLDTMRNLQEVGIKYVGGGENLNKARELKIIEKNDVKVGFLAYSVLAYSSFGSKEEIPAANENKSGVAPYDKEMILQDIDKYKEECDILLISMHWGVEYTHEPTKADREFAKQMIDAGADGILGHHPHNLQGMEIYKGKPIIYSMSNFIFDQNDDPNKDSGIFKMSYKNGDFKELEFTPLRIVDKQRSVHATGDIQKRILNDMSEYCEKVDQAVEIKDGKLYIKV